MLRHLITTTSENKVQQYLEHLSNDNKSVFVLTSRIPDDDIHLRYDVFKVTKENRRHN